MTTLGYRLVLNEEEMDAVWEGISLYLSRCNENWKNETDEIKKRRLSDHIENIDQMRFRLRSNWFKASYTVFPKDAKQSKEPKGFT